MADLPVRWHFIGHLQRNKVRRTLPFTALIHSVDSPRLAEAIEESAAELSLRGCEKMGLAPNRDDENLAKNDRREVPVPIFSQPLRVPVLLEVHTSGEAAKSGLEPDGIERELPKLAEFRHLEIRGLMCMAALEGGLDVARRNFADLRLIRDRLRANCPENIRLDELSMGMSGDYEVAIEEGATIVRIGSALFEGVA